MWELIQANKRKSLILFFCMGICLLLLGYIVAAAYHRQAGVFGLLIAFAVWVILSLISFFSGDSIILAISKAKEINHDVHPQLFNIVEEMKIAAGLPKIPKVYIIDDPSPNAFAVGRNPEKSAIAVTSGLLSRLRRDELQGVVAHETSHIMNRDVLFCTFAGIMLGSIVLISQIFLRSLWYSGGSRRSSSRRSSGGGGGQAQAIMMIVAIVFAILAPLIARLLYLAISRKREYLADASAVRLTRYPEGLASALQKISSPRFAPKKATEVNKVTAPMYIVNPFEITKKKLSSWSSTHPPTSERIRILRSMHHGVSLTAYQQALTGLGKETAAIMPKSALTDTENIPITKPTITEKESSSKQKTREVGDLLRAVNGYAFLACACGMKIKLPGNYNKPEVTCPRCQRKLQVPLTEIATAMMAAGEAIKQKDKVTAGKTAAPQATYNRKGGGWESFNCSCGKVVSISPALKAPAITCRHCGRQIKIN